MVKVWSFEGLVLGALACLTILKAWKCLLVRRGGGGVESRTDWTSIVSNDYRLTAIPTTNPIPSIDT